jgi:Iron/manganese superoxide dismutases, C-terminal domain
MFWSIMAPPGSANSAPMGALKEKIEADFGSFDEMKAKFNAGAAARFGSGWEWLSLGEDGKLFLSSTPNQVCCHQFAAVDVSRTVLRKDQCTSLIGVLTRSPRFCLSIHCIEQPSYGWHRAVWNPHPWSRRLGARLLPEVSEPPPGVHCSVCLCTL